MSSVALLGSGAGPRGQVLSGTSGGIQFNSNGTVTTLGGTRTPPDYYEPTTAGIASKLWINITRTSGTGGVNFSIAQGSWVSLNGIGAITAAGAAGSCSGTYQLATSSGGTPVVATGTITSTNGT